MAKNYFDRQSEITSRMRTILVDWIIEVHYKYRLNPLTLWLCINIMDRYLEKHDIDRTKLQLVGITALFVACKFEEIHSPQVADCVHLTDNAYSKEDILKTEASMLSTLDYQFIVPTGYHFLIRFFHRMKASERVRLISSFIAERNLQEIEVLMFSPRLYAASCVYIALYTVNIDQYPNMSNIWTPELEEESGGLKENDLLPCVRTLLTHVKEVPQGSSKRKLDAARKKYAIAERQFISELHFPNI
jgi:transcription initiation factor TFIIIB Brf1 subunit/transcription initiation factor TFIIB